MWWYASSRSCSIANEHPIWKSSYGIAELLYTRHFLDDNVVYFLSPAWYLCIIGLRVKSICFQRFWLGLASVQFYWMLPLWNKYKKTTSKYTVWYGLRGRTGKWNAFSWITPAPNDFYESNPVSAAKNFLLFLIQRNTFGKCNSKNREIHWSFWGSCWQRELITVYTRNCVCPVSWT